MKNIQLSSSYLKCLGGFTLTELMITISVAAILASTAVPSFSDMIKRNRVITQQNDLLGDIMLARIEAIKRGYSVSICSANLAATGCSGSKIDWHQGWLIYVNSDKHGVYDSNDGDELLRIHDPFVSSTRLDYTYTTLTFNSRGFMSGSDVNARFAFCNTNDEVDYEREIKMLSTGRASRREATASTCI
jgi:type IV fimbrial biogenesis protein FimT|tara:strand:+ start:1034 stop:1600 length:567 start_codon:yes stop_codon:yes gene_type:complete